MGTSFLEEHPEHSKYILNISSFLFLKTSRVIKVYFRGSKSLPHHHNYFLVLLIILSQGSELCINGDKLGLNAYIGEKSHTDTFPKEAINSNNIRG